MRLNLILIIAASLLLALNPIFISVVRSEYTPGIHAKFKNFYRSNVLGNSAYCRVVVFECEKVKKLTELYLSVLVGD